MRYYVQNSSLDYYPFGSIQPGRSFSSQNYRFGFNGKEKDDEGMGGGGSTYDYGFRIYNPQIAKFLSVDPLAHSYPWYTPYQFAGNKPIVAIDLDGLEEYIVINYYNGNNVKIKSTIEVVLSKAGDRVNRKAIDNGVSKANNLVHTKDIYSDKTSKNTYQDALTIDQVKALKNAKVVGTGNFRDGEGNLMSDVTIYRANIEVDPPPPPNNPINDENTEHTGGGSPPITTTNPGGTPQTPTVPAATPIDPDMGLIYTPTSSGKGWEKHSNFDNAVNLVADWLNNNPNYNLDIKIGGAHKGNLLFKEKWNDNIGLFTGTTYGQRTEGAINAFKSALKTKGVDVDDRVNISKGGIKWRHNEINEVKK